MRVGTPGRGGAPQLHRARGPAEGVRLLFAAAGARARITDDGGRKTENGGRRGGRGPAASGNASAGEGSGSRTGSGRCTLRRGALGWTVVGGRWSVVGGRLPMDFGLGYRSPSTHYPLLPTRYWASPTGSGRCTLRRGARGRRAVVGGQASVDFGLGHRLLFPRGARSACFPRRRS